MSIIEAVIQGIIQGATEFLPVSSSGHLSVFQYFTGSNNELSIVVDVLLHLGTLIAVFIIFHKRIWELIKEFFYLLRDIFTGRFSFKGMGYTRKMLIFLFISTLMTALVMLIPLPNGEKLMDLFEGIAGNQDIVVEGICFLFTAALLYFASRQSEKKANKEMNAKDAVAIGLIQGLAVVPGISRSGSTSSVGLMRGLGREEVINYSFIMSIPAILGAALVKIGDIKDAATSGDSGVKLLPLLLGILVSALVGILAIKLVAFIIKTNKLKIFSYYCFVLGLIVVIIGIFELAFGHPLQSYISSIF